MNTISINSICAIPLSCPNSGILLQLAFDIGLWEAQRLQVKVSAVGGCEEKIDENLYECSMRSAGNFPQSSNIGKISIVLPDDFSWDLRLDISGKYLFLKMNQSVTLSNSEIMARLLHFRNKTMHAQIAPHHQWMLEHRADENELHSQRELVSSWDTNEKPLISVITPVFNPPVNVLKAMIDSVISQTYDNWELILANASGRNDRISELLKSYNDKRIHVIEILNRSIAENTNAAIAVSHGDYVAFVDHDDFIEPDALYRYIIAIHNNPHCDLFFCDEDLCRTDGEGVVTYFGPRFKPGWNYDLVLTHNYICHLLMVSRWSLDKTARSNVDVSAAQDYDLTLKVSEIARAIWHEPRVLYHWRVSETSISSNRDSKPYAFEAGRLTIQQHLDRVGIAASVHKGSFPLSYRIVYNLPDPAVGVSIILINRGGDIERAVRSLRSVTEYPWDRYEIVIVSEAKSVSGIRRTIRRELNTRQYGTSNISVIKAPADASDLKMLQTATRFTAFDTVVCVDSWCEAVEGNWLTELIEPLQRRDIMISSALLLDEDGVLNAFGLMLRQDGSLVRVGTGLELTDPGYMSMMFHARDCDVVPNVGVAFRKEAFYELQRERTVDSWEELCLSARTQGGIVIVEPYGPLKLWRAAIRDQDEMPNKHRLEIASKCAAGDSYLNPLLDSRSGYFTIK